MKPLLHNSVAFCCCILFMPLVSATATNGQQGQTTLTGWMSIIWETPAAGPVHVHYLLTDGSGQRYALNITQGVATASGGPRELQGARVELTLRAPTLRASTAAPLEVAAIRVLAKDRKKTVGSTDQFSAAAVSGSQPVATLLCKYASTKGKLEKKSHFEELMGPTHPGMDHYFREISYDNINLTGSEVHGWYDLPLTYTEYNNLADGLNRIVEDCTAAADTDVYFPDFFNMNIMLSESGIGNWGGGLVLTLDGVNRFWGVAWISDWENSQAVVAHEMGHVFGLPHSSGPYGQTYDSLWDVMSGGGLLHDNQFGYLADHTISYHKDILGWIPATQEYTGVSGSTQTITLERLALPTDGGTAYLMATVPIDATHFYTVEARRFAGYDDGLPGEAVVIHEVDPLRSNEAQVVDPDGNGDPNDSGAMFVPGEVFDDPANGISVSVDSDTGTGYVVTISRAAADFPDLVITLLSGPPSAAPGETISVSGTVLNQGTGSTTIISSAGIYLSSDAVISGDGDDIFVGWVSNPILAGGASAPFSGSVTVPGSVVLGTYNLGAIADDQHRVVEDGNESNNAFLNGTIDIADAAPTVTTSTAADITESSATLNGVVNPHGQATNAWFEWGLTTAYGNMTPLQDVGSGDTGTTFNDTLTGLAPGTTYHFRAAAQNASGTSYGADQSFTTSIVVDVDLLPIDMVTPTLITLGSRINIDVTAQNQGSVDSEQFALAVHLSDTPDLTGSFLELAARGSPQVLPAGGSYTESFMNVPVPPSSPIGNVYMVAAADAYDWIAESDETNNLLAIPVEVRAADLVVLEVTGPKSVRIGEPISGTVTIRNQGNDWTQVGFDIELYLSFDNVIITDDFSLGTIAWNALLDGETRTINWSKSFPLGVGKGTYYVGAIVDSADVVVESDETNNSAASVDTTRVR